jgi:Fur family transcriptional regulator, ferric uptake regulator
MRAMTSSDSQRGSVDRSGTGQARGVARRSSARTRETPRKRALLTVLGAADEFLTVPQLHRRLRTELESQGLRVGIATVYSQLRRLVAAGDVDVLLGDDGESRYWLPRREAHHHYLVCRSCGRALEIVAAPVEEWAERLATELGFDDVTHSFEMYGMCPNCTGSAEQFETGSDSRMEHT